MATTLLHRIHQWLGPDLSQLAAFVLIAEERSFRRAAARLGRDPSTLSHAMRDLEAEVGVQLLNRTTRSVGLTEAGTTFLRTISPALSDIDGAVEAMNGYRAAPIGTLRITASQTAYMLALKPMVPAFARDYPDVTVEISIEEGYVDIVEERFDAGIRMGNSIGAEMTAVRVTHDSRQAVVAAPLYLARWGIPKQPVDLLAHRCIQYRLVRSQTLAPWSFAKGRESMDLQVTGPLVFDTPPLMLDAAIEGAGIAMVMEDIAEPHIRSGRLSQVLDDWCPRLPGFYLYYPSRRHHSAALGAFIGRIRYRKPDKARRGR